jgi:hypothetical protein
MKKIICALALSAPLMLTGCVTETVVVDSAVYDPGFSNDYVYSVGYYNNRPYWGNNYYYYPAYYSGPNGYWGGGYYNGY